MKRTFLAAVLLLPGLAFAQDPTGTWQTGKSDAGAYLHVKIGPCASGSEQRCGVIVKTIGAEQDLAGTNIISNMKPEGSGKYSGGTIWAPDQDKRYRSKMVVSDNSLKVSGCVAGGVICRSQTWTRLR